MCLSEQLDAELGDGGQHNHGVELQSLQVLLLDTVRDGVNGDAMLQDRARRRERSVGGWGVGWGVEGMHTVAESFATCCTRRVINGTRRERI
jgi:hypothetical protein